MSLLEVPPGTAGILPAKSRQDAGGPGLYEAWLELRPGGLFLDEPTLARLPVVPPVNLSDLHALRAAWTDRDPDAVDAALLEAVLERVCGLKGWNKALSADAARTLIDGTTLKPRWRWHGPNARPTCLFTTTAPALGTGKGKRLVSQALEYIRLSGEPFALCTNGAQWRLIWADTDHTAWVEWEAEAWLHGEAAGPTLEVLRHLLAALEGGVLLGLIREARRGQGKLSRDLGEHVRQAVELLLKHRRPVLAPVFDQHRPADLYAAACRVVMRLVVTLFAEARDLFPRDHPIYHRAYGLEGLIEALDRAGEERRQGLQQAWPRLLALFDLLHRGSAHPNLPVPKYGGALFAPGRPDGDPVERALAVLESPEHAPSDEVVYRALRLLTRTQVRVREGKSWRRVASRVDFTELSSEYIGILYEGLLDYELKRAGAEPVVFLALGDQPALPLDRLEAMSDPQIAELVEKVKKSGKIEKAEEAEEEAEEAEADEEDEDEAEEDEAPEETPELDGAEAVVQRARAWAARAVVAGKLAKKPRGKGGEAAFTAEVDRVARTLIARIEQPGDLYLVRWGGTRKGAGTFYTRPQLTLPTVRRTLEPLLSENGQLRSPEQILSLKVCDPAMGSGSFLVATLKVLAEAVVASLKAHQRLTYEGDTLKAVDCRAFDGDVVANDDDLVAVARRLVVEHCLYGVDLDPLAVELARVALWVETLAKSLPFTFLDHKLRCGDALLGGWLDQVRDYPIRAWERVSVDAEQSKALKARRSILTQELAGMLDGRVMADLVAGLNDDGVKQAIAEVRDLWAKMRKIPAHEAGRRAAFWRDKIRDNPAVKRLHHAFDTWCALWFWPLDRLDEAPGPRDFLDPSSAAAATVRKVAEDLRFFHWELAFPDVFTAQGSGFDAVVGNPPWEIQKPNSREFFSNLDPVYRAYGKQEALRRQAELFAETPEVEPAWLAYQDGYKARGNWVTAAADPFAVSLSRKKSDNEGLHKRWNERRARHKGFADPEHPFRHQGSADLNTYKLFVEVAHALLRGPQPGQPGGQLGLIVPSGLYTDKGTAPLRKLLLEHCTWRWLYSHENRDGIFAIHRSFKFAVVIAAKGGHTEAVQAAFMRHDLEDWSEARGVIDYPAERVKAFSPRSLAILELRSLRDLELLTKLYKGAVLLGDEGPAGWGIRYAREFDMTNDSKLFPGREKWEALCYRPDEYGRWIGPEGDVALPLFQGAMIHQFDFASKGWDRNEKGKLEWVPRPPGERRPLPKYLIGEEHYADKEPTSRGLRLGFRDITRSTDERTAIASLVPDFPCGNVVGMLLPRHGQALGLIASFDSFAFDWSVRQRIAGTHMNWYVVEELPALPVVYDAPWLGHAAALGMAGPAFTPYWKKEHILAGHRWALTPHERLRLRCLLDAVVAALYGLDRDDFRWILRDCDHPVEALTKAFCRTLDPKGFWRVDKDQPPHLRHTVLSLVAFDHLLALIERHGQRDAGIAAFCAGDGWQLPETLTLSDHDLGHDEAAKKPQPVAAALGPRFLDWQLAQTPEEAWAECERHAAALGHAAGPAPVNTRPKPSLTPQPSLPGLGPAQLSFFDE